jgi:plastocyanin
VKATLASAENAVVAQAKGETTMRDRATRIYLTVIALGVLVLIVTGVGMFSILRATAVGGNSLPIVQTTPVIGVTHVFVHNNAYQPANIQVVWGTTVSWTNQDSAVHSVVLPHISDSETDIRESGPLNQGQTFNYTFLARGTFQYYCIEHQYMIGIVIVT